MSPVFEIGFYTESGAWYTGLSRDGEAYIPYGSWLLHYRYAYPLYARIEHADRPYTEVPVTVRQTEAIERKWNRGTR